MRKSSEGKNEMRTTVKDLNLRREGLRLQQTRAVGQIFVSVSQSSPASSSHIKSHKHQVRE